MKKEIRSEIEIGAPPERVWKILTDFASYPQWNPFITRVDGSAVRGARIGITLIPPGSKPMGFKPTIVILEPESMLVWQGRAFLPGLFDGEHRFRIRQIDDDRVLFLQEETFSGLLVPFFSKALFEATQRGFDAMNLALKNEAEREAMAADGG